MIGPMTQIHNIAENKVTIKSLIIYPHSQPPDLFNKHEQAAEMTKLYTRGVFVTDDFMDMMPSDHISIKSVDNSDTPPLKVSSPMNAAHKSTALGEQNHGVKTCLIMFDEARKLYYGADNDDVSSKSTIEVTVTMNNTATLRPDYLLNATVNDEDEIEAPPDQYDDHDQAEMLEDMKEKKIAPLDALFPKIRVPSDDQNMHKSTQEDETNPAVKAAETMLYAKSKLAINTWALTHKTYQEDGSRAKSVMMMTLHIPTDRQDQTTSPALSKMREQVDDVDQTEVKMAPFATEGAEGIAKCPSTWPAHFTAVTTRSFLRQQGRSAAHYQTVPA
jgi:hypothetical protein